MFNRAADRKSKHQRRTDKLGTWELSLHVGYATTLIGKRAYSLLILLVSSMMAFSSTNPERSCRIPSKVPVSAVVCPLASFSLVSTAKPLLARVAQNKTLALRPYAIPDANHVVKCPPVIRFRI
ncbi:unnamed protein product [Periconia digitata]|uniref:Uncharacterized protein n=1 Tax=Periconia digitata TaxID=1303443 RepID=A0A9W4U4W6_9PLEO|nr:unnamed protein product [Periconia digitata]